LRNLSSGILTLLEGNKFRIEYGWKGIFNGSPVRLWTGFYSLTYNSEVYSGNGWLHRIDGWKETAFNQSFGQSIDLTGVSQELLSLVLNNSTQTSTGEIFVFFLNDDGSLIDGFCCFKGVLDQVHLMEGASTASLSISYESKLIKLREKREVRFTDSFQRSKYPDDVGFEYVSNITNQRIYWGQPDTTRNR
jgi:hypothetical protein